MRYICCLLLGLAPAVWGMEETTAVETRQPLGERQIEIDLLGEK